MRRVFDCTIINDELDMLELRFRTLEDVVDTFIVVEARQTHSGRPKPFHVAENPARFARWAGRTVLVNFDPIETDSWRREYEHRAHIAWGWGLAKAKPGDLLIVADVDEIPRPEAVAQIGPQGARLELDFYYYNAHTRVNEGWSIGALPYGVEADPNHVRTLAGHDVPVIEHAGWHLSYMGGAARIAGKLDDFMHHADPGIRETPRDLAWIQNRIDRGEDLYGRAISMTRLDHHTGDLPAPMLTGPVYAGWL